MSFQISHDYAGKFCSGLFCNGVDCDGFSGEDDSCSGLHCDGLNCDGLDLTHVSITKLPKNRTDAEPVYPDLILTGVLADALFHVYKSSLNDNEFKISYDNLYAYYGIDMNRFLIDLGKHLKDEEVLDTSIYINTSKQSFPWGKPANNNDPYPVDKKIAELQKHEPRIKIPDISYTTPYIGCSEPLSKAILDVSDTTEKRIARLENILSTALRYLFRLSSRVNINCVYYGGQEASEKYNAIRCLHDDLIQDGQLMSLDQCLVCTRYEPVIGQIYEATEQLSLRELHDLTQQSYMSIEEYVTFTKTEKMHMPQDKPSVKLNIQQRSGEFKNIWPQGFVMNWSLTPIETQSPDIR